MNKENCALKLFDEIIIYLRYFLFICLFIYLLLLLNFFLFNLNSLAWSKYPFGFGPQPYCELDVWSSLCKDRVGLSNAKSLFLFIQTKDQSQAAERDQL